MSTFADIVSYIFLVGVIPLAYCILSFLGVINAFSKANTVIKFMWVCVVCGFSFVVFQIMQSTLVVGYNYLSYGLEFGFSNSDFHDMFLEIYDLLTDFSLVFSWGAVSDLFFIDKIIGDWHPEYLFQVELIYILFYAVLGLVMGSGIKILKIKTPIQFVGLFILITTSIIYTLGMFFWMATGFYL